MNHPSTPNRQDHPNRRETPAPTRTQPYRTASPDQMRRGLRRERQRAERRTMKTTRQISELLRAEELLGAA